MIQKGKTAKKPIKERIGDTLSANGGSMPYADLMYAVFPPDIYPNAWRYQMNGGPPGCAMAFGRALREMGCHDSRNSKTGSRMVVMPRTEILSL